MLDSLRPHGPPGSSLHGILQARTLEWVVIPFSRESSWPRNQIQVSCIGGRFFTVWVTREVCVCLQVCIRVLSPDLEWEGWMSFQIGLKHASAQRKHTHTLQLRLLTRLGTHGTTSNLVPLSLHSHKAQRVIVKTKWDGKDRVVYNTD